MRPFPGLKALSTHANVTLAHKQPGAERSLGTEGRNRKSGTVMQTKRVSTRILPVSAVFHTKQVENALKPFMQTLANVSISPTQIPVLSKTTGKPYPTDSESVKRLLGEQLLHPVNFASEIENMYDSGIRTFIETGPRSVLTGLVKSILKDREFNAVSIDSSSGRLFGVFDLAKVICRIASSGYGVNLGIWEDPPEKAENRRMSIPISGANYLKQTEERSEEKLKPDKTDDNKITKPKIPSDDPMSTTKTTFEKRNNPDFLNRHSEWSRRA